MCVRTPSSHPSHCRSLKFIYMCINPWGLTLRDRPLKAVLPKCLKSLIRRTWVGCYKRTVIPPPHRVMMGLHCSAWFCKDPQGAQQTSHHGYCTQPPEPIGMWQVLRQQLHTRVLIWVFDEIIDVQIRGGVLPSPIAEAGSMLAVPLTPSSVQLTVCVLKRR